MKKIPNKNLEKEKKNSKKNPAVYMYLRIAQQYRNHAVTGNLTNH
jgi:hypothetical protein